MKTFIHKVGLIVAVFFTMHAGYGQEIVRTHSNVYIWEFEPKVKEYHHSGDFSEQLLIFSGKAALIKYLAKDEPNKLGFTLAQVDCSGGEPEFESLSDCAITKELAYGIQRICMVSTNKLLVDTGTHATDPRYALVDLDPTQKTLHANDLKDLPLDKTREIVWVPASIYFDRQLVSFLSPGK